MKNAATGIGLAVLGLGIAVNGLNLNGNQADATSAAFKAGPVEPTIVWYGVESTRRSNSGSYTVSHCIYRAWSDGTIEMRVLASPTSSIFAPVCGAIQSDNCVSDWIVISSPNEGLNARADINFDERVDAADLGLLVAAWGDAPRNDYPPSDCPLGLIP